MATRVFGDLQNCEFIMKHYKLLILFVCFFWGGCMLLKFDSLSISLLLDELLNLRNSKKYCSYYL